MMYIMQVKVTAYGISSVLCVSHTSYKSCKIHAENASGEALQNLKDIISTTKVSNLEYSNLGQHIFSPSSSLQDNTMYP